jgi:tetratricopeptide (TPR) repeat protein
VNESSIARRALWLIATLLVLSSAAVPRAFSESEPVSRDLAFARYDLALKEESCARFIEAERHYHQAAEMFESMDGPEASTTGVARGRLAGVYVQMGRYSAAENLLQKCLQSATAAFGPDSNQVASVVANLAFLRMAEKKWVAAEPLLRRAAAIYENIGNRELVGSILSAQAWILYVQNDKQEAFKAAERASNALNESTRVASVPQARALAVMGLVYASQGNIDEAISRFESAIDMTTVACGAEHPSVAYLLARYSEVLYRAHRKREARAASKRSREILGHGAGRSGLGLTVDFGALGNIPAK